jgi:O-methyltransferase involved in polyketide biosynthesis
MRTRRPDAISPTAHYTGEVWRRNGLGHEALGTRQGRILFQSARPLLALGSLLGGERLEGFLLARHRLIDSLLEAEIEAGRIGQVVEIAAGMSPRGLRISERHPDVVYIEGDLPAMAARKRGALARAGARHRVAELDALSDDGPQSLAAIAAELEPGRGLAVITEGLLNYFPRDEVEGIWRRIVAALGGFSDGIYLSDVHLRSDIDGGVATAFGALLGVFVRGRVHFPFADPVDAQGALAAAGFTSSTLHSGTEGGSEAGAERVRVIEARTGS